SVADSQSNLAECLCARARTAGPDSLKEAESLVRRCLSIREKYRPPGHWTTANARSLLGETLALQGRFAEAEPLILAGYEGVVSAPGARPERRRRAGQRIVELYQAWGKSQQVEEWRARLSDPSK